MVRNGHKMGSGRREGIEQNTVGLNPAGVKSRFEIANGREDVRRRR